MDPSLQCAWAAYASPTIQFCEARTCGFPAEPVNAWTNLAYVLVGLYVLYRARREGHWNLWPGGATAIGIGFGSFSFHAFPTLYTEYMDLFSMFLLSIYLLAIQLYRVFGLSVRQSVLAYVIILATSTAGLLFAKDLGITIFGIQCVSALLFEFVLKERANKAGVQIEYRYFWALIAAFLIAFIFWALDLLRIVCDPGNHWIQGHGFWHLINSTCLLWLYLYGKQFEWTRSIKRDL